jgi:hypothetical protein
MEELCPKHALPMAQKKSNWRKISWFMEFHIRPQIQYWDQVYFIISVGEGKIIKKQENG